MKLRPIIILLMVFLMSSCQYLVGYKPGYDRVSLFDRETVKFPKIGVEINLPKQHRITTNNEKYLDIYLHTFYPDDMFVEYTTTYFISISKYNEEEYNNPKYFMEDIHAPFFHEDTKYIIKKQVNMRLGTEIVHELYKHIRDHKGNIYVLNISIYPWPEGTISDVEDDMNAAFKTINYLKLL